MNRSALIIASPGERNEEGYLPGVEMDMRAYVQFLKSALGGAWRDEEIKVFRNPSKLVVQAGIVHQSTADFSMTVFCGHGYHNADEDSTYVVLGKTEHVDSKLLRRGAGKHVLILDCCRELQPTPKLESYREVTAAAKPSLSRSECRKFYDQTIEKCSKGLAVLHGCAVDEVSNEDSEEGGYYSNGLISAANKWFSKSAVGTSAKFAILDIASAHKAAKEAVVERSGDRQHPKIENPRSENQFPFAVIA